MALVWVTAGKKRDRKGISLWVCTGASVSRDCPAGVPVTGQERGRDARCRFPDRQQAVAEGEDVCVFRNVGGDAGGLSR